MRRRMALAVFVSLLVGCSGSENRPGDFVVVTFNTGTSEGLDHDAPPDDGYGSTEAALSDTYYGNGLAWRDAVEATRAWLADVSPDVVVFQEIFHTGDCASVPIDARKGFVCEGWSPGDPTVAQAVTGAGYQVMCNPGHPDKCAAVERAFGSFRGCDADLCLEGLDGFEVPGCGSGARVGRGIIDRVDGGTVTLVDFHGTSGFTFEDQQCRRQQFEQVFVDLGDGMPGASGDRNLVMGDLNTDPGRVAGPDVDRLLDFVGPPDGGKPFHFVTDVGPDAEPTYAGLFNIDHVMSDAFDGDCWTAGDGPDHPPVFEGVYFDHRPVVCTVR